MTSDSRRDEGALLNRAEWLRVHGFDYDPFPMESFRGEKDPLLRDAFLDPDDVDFEQIIGTPEKKGYFFIFAAAGAGKSSLCRRIRNELEPLVVIAGRRSLVVEYSDYLHDRAADDECKHVLHLSQLIEQSLGLRPTDGSRPLLGESGLDAAYTGLEKAIDACWKQGFNAVYILVDVDSPWSEGAADRDTDLGRILSLASSTRLLDIEGLIFKFLLPSEYKSAYGAMLSKNGKFPLYELTWDRDRLQRALEDRVIACQTQSSKTSVSDPRLERRPGDISLLAQLCTGELYGTIATELVEFGQKRGSPRAMWQLGYYLLEEHFNLSPNPRRRTRDELINRRTLYSAYSRLSRELPPAVASQESGAMDEKICQEIKDLINKGDPDSLDAALERLQLVDERWAREMRSRLNRAKVDYGRGRLGRNDYDVILNQIVGNCLERLC